MFTAGALAISILSPTYLGDIQRPDFAQYSTLIVSFKPKHKHVCSFNTFLLNSHVLGTRAPKC